MNEKSSRESCEYTLRACEAASRAGYPARLLRHHNPREVPRRVTPKELGLNHMEPAWLEACKHQIALRDHLSEQRVGSWIELDEAILVGGCCDGWGSVVALCKLLDAAGSRRLRVHVKTGRGVMPADCPDTRLHVNMKRAYNLYERDLSRETATQAATN